MHNGDGKTLVSLLYTIKFFKSFVPYESLLDITILLISILSIPGRLRLI